MESWQTIFPEEDRKVYEGAGFIYAQRFGAYPALLIIDVVESFTGRKDLSHEDSMKEYRTSCGPSSWKAVENIRILLDAARKAGWLVVYVKGDPVSKFFCGDSIKTLQGEEVKKLQSTDIPEMIRPQDDEFILKKTKASAFFGTPLSTYLRQHGIDTLVIVGTTTSGCIRCSVIDAFSHGFSTFVVADCCFDRSNFSHMVNLYEMNLKYADVKSLEEILAFTRKEH